MPAASGGGRAGASGYTSHQAGSYGAAGTHREEPHGGASGYSPVGRSGGYGGAGGRAAGSASGGHMTANHAASGAPGHIVSRSQPLTGHAAAGPVGARSQQTGRDDHGATPERHGSASDARAHGSVDDHGHVAGMVRTHDGRLALVSGSGRTIADRPTDRTYLHADARPGAKRDPAAVDRDRAFTHAHDGDFRQRDVRRFDARDLGRWRAGLWRNEWHYGRRGWWWDVGGVWYPYDDPIYPFPLVVAALVVYDTAILDGPDVEAYETDDPSAGPPGAGAAIPPLPAPPAGYYRCSEPTGYYPFVGACGASWGLVQDAPPPP